MRLGVGVAALAFCLRAALAEPLPWEALKQQLAGAILQAATPPTLALRILQSDGLPDGLADSAGERLRTPPVLDELLAATPPLLGIEPFYAGNLGPFLLGLRGLAMHALDTQQTPTPTPAQAALITRAARVSGHLGLRQRALALREALAPPDTPWICDEEPINASTCALLACTDAYLLSGEAADIDRARAWATYAAPLEVLRTPAARAHAYALLNLADLDTARPWRQIAEAILTTPCDAATPAAALNVTTLGLARIHGAAPELFTLRVPARVGEAVLNSVLVIPAVLGQVGEGTMAFTAVGREEKTGYALIAPAPCPKAVENAGAAAASVSALDAAHNAWFHDREAQALLFKIAPGAGETRIRVTW